MRSDIIGLIAITYCFTLVPCVAAHDIYPVSLAEQLNQYCEWQQRYTKNNGSENIRYSTVGKAGPRGYPGPVGPEGKVNYTIVETLAGAKCDEKIINLTKKISKLEEDIYRITHKDCNTAIESDSKIWNGTGGVFQIYPFKSRNSVEVYCDVATDEGGWIVFQRRFDGSENFQRDFASYTHGFGKRDKEFWLGLDNLYGITKHRRFELRVDLTDWDNNKAHASYSHFSVGDASSQYELTVSGYSGTAGDALSQHSGSKFYTKDRDSTNGDSHKYKGGWWYHIGYTSNLNGIYVFGGSYKFLYPHGVEWHSWRRRHWISLKFVEMKIRPKQ